MAISNKEGAVYEKAIIGDFGCLKKPYGKDPALSVETPEDKLVDLGMEDGMSPSVNRTVISRGGLPGNSRNVSHRHVIWRAV